MPLKLLHDLFYVIDSQFEIIIAYRMYAPTSQYFSKYNSLFNNEKAFTEKEMKLVFISYIWDNDCIKRHDEINWKLLWGNKLSR